MRGPEKRSAPSVQRLANLHRRVNRADGHRHVLRAPAQLVLGEALLHLEEEVAQQPVAGRAERDARLGGQVHLVHAHLVERHLLPGASILGPDLHRRDLDLQRRQRLGLVLAQLVGRVGRIGAAG